ncbi:hypothetical protein BH09DEP1_BH09DEP1_7730 [soil metagenome]
MNLRTALFGLVIIFHGPTSPFSFSAFFGGERGAQFNDPTHEECKQWAQDRAYLGSILLSSSMLMLYAMLNNDLPSSLIATTSTFSVLLSQYGLHELAWAGAIYLEHRNPYKTKQWIAKQKQNKNYAKMLSELRATNNQKRMITHDKQIYVGAGTLLAGFLMTYTHEDKNLCYILTVAGMATILDKIISEFNKT